MDSCGHITASLKGFLTPHTRAVIDGAQSFSLRAPSIITALNSLWGQGSFRSTAVTWLTTYRRNRCNVQTGSEYESEEKNEAVL